MKKLDPIIYKVKITTETGLHIGGGGAGIEIGGIENTVIKDKDGYPYIPGSSLKGKFRSLVEVREGKFCKDGKDKGGPHKFGSDIECLEGSCRICRAFGVAGTLKGNDLKEKIKDNEWKNKLKEEVKKLDFEEKEKNKILGGIDEKQIEDEAEKKVFSELLNKIGPTRMIVRDLKLLSKENTENKKPQDKEKFDTIIEKGENPLEEKTEVAIDRYTGTAARSGPRTMERVPSGTVFQGEIVFRVFDTNDDRKGDRDEEIAKELFESGLLKKLIENDYLGGQGSRGSGQITIEFVPKEPESGS